MGRYSSGALTKGEAARIELSYLLKKGMIKKGCFITGRMAWNDGSSIDFESEYSDNRRFLRLIYVSLKEESGTRIRHDYRIGLETIPSNLGRGEVLYFACPITGRRTRILFLCYGSLTWKSRYAFKNRIYYESQLYSKQYYYLSKHWAIKEKLEKCYQARRKRHYQGKETRLLRRIRLLEEKLNTCLDQILEKGEIKQTRWHLTG